MNKQIAKDVFIVAAKRTPFGAFGGSLKFISAVELGALSARAALDQVGPNSASLIDSVVFGNVSQTTVDCAYLGRHAGLKAGVSEDVPMFTVNRLCGSGFQSVVTATQEILLGESSMVIAGGAENMSLAPHHALVRWGVPFTQSPPMVDSLWEALNDAHVKLPMAMTAENLAEKVGVDKAESDNWALRSQQRWKNAHDNGYFNNEIVPVEIKKKGKTIEFKVDEHPRPETTLEGLTKLRAIFKKDGVVSAGNASGVNDGAGALILANEEKTKAEGLKPLAKILGYSVVGVDPKIMGIGPVPAIKNAVANAGLTLNDMDLIEINEAFACQFVACQKELGLTSEEFDDKLNVSGGAVAIGHPTGASGSRIMSHLVYELERRGKKYGVGSACIGGGQGIAIVIERL
eukprot:maker-scaffold_45-snap-gene-1.106-mRNA-1 protein AED:0.02 eAED:0.02 QI:352/1/1/1/0.5/0.33/3/411/402